MTDPEPTPPPFATYVPGPEQHAEALAPEPALARRPEVGASSRRRGALVAAVVLGVLVLMAGTGAGVWLLTRQGPAAAPAAAASASGTVDVAGVIQLERGQFVWQSVQDPSCEGLQGFADIRAGAQVVVTDASGKVLAVGSLEMGTAQGITTETGGMSRASSCVMAFKVGGIPRGVGPYGVEVAHRGVLRYDEGHLAILRLSF